MVEKKKDLINLLNNNSQKNYYKLRLKQFKITLLFIFKNNF
jgi:hypothetical protein